MTPRAKTLVKRAGAVVLGLVALDLLLGAATVAFGWELLKR